MSEPLGQLVQEISRRLRWQVLMMLVWLPVAGEAQDVWVTQRNAATVAVIDPATNEVVGQVALRPGVLPEDIVVDAGVVWVTAFSGELYRIDPLTRAVVTSFNISTYAGGIGARNGSVWVSNGDLLQASRVDVEANGIAGRVESELAVYDVAVTAQAAWMVAQEGHLRRLDGITTSTAGGIHVDGEPNSLAAGDTDVWASDLNFVLPDGSVQEIDVGVMSSEAPDLAVGAGSVWVATAENGFVIRIDESTSTVLATIDLGGWVEDVAVGAGAVWAVLPEDAEVVRIDPTTNEVVARIRVRGFPNALAVAP